MTLTFDSAPTPPTATTSANQNWNQTIGAGSDRLLKVAVAVGIQAGTGTPHVAVTAVKGGVDTAMTPLTGEVGSGVGGATGFGYVQVFYMLDPDVGTNTIKVTRTGGTGTIDLRSSSVSYRDAGVPVVKSTVQGNGTGSQGATFSILSGSIGFSVAIHGNQITTGSDTQLWLVGSGNASGASWHRGAHRVGASGSITMTHTFAATDDFAILGIEIPDIVPPPPAPVEFVSQGVAVGGSTAVSTAAYGTGWADGDLAVCAVATNHTTVEATEPTMPAGWDKIGTFISTGGTQGAGTGNRRLTFFTRVVATGDDTTPTISLSGGNVMIAAITIFKKAAGYTWATAVAAFGAETTAGTSWSEVMTSDPGFAATDMLLAACAVRDTSTSSAEGFTATGATFSALTEQVDFANETGNDLNLHVSTADVLTGPSSAAGTRTATHSTSETGVMGVLRIRSIAPSGEVIEVEGWGIRM